jgi:hypothetical protein
VARLEKKVGWLERAEHERHGMHASDRPVRALTCHYRPPLSLEELGRRLDLRIVKPRGNGKPVNSSRGCHRRADFPVGVCSASQIRPPLDVTVSLEFLDMDASCATR